MSSPSSLRPLPLFARSVLTLAACLATAAFASRARAQESAPPPPPPPAESPTTQEPAVDETAGIHPDAVSSFQVRAYHISEKKLWKGLLQVLQEAGYPPEEVNAKDLRVKTSFVDFTSKDYSEEVAEPAPHIGPNYHILQMNKVKLGKVSLEGLVTSGEHGAAVLSLRARILVDGLDQQNRIRVLADRRSSGVIESDFMGRLEETLHLERM
jgi:hypothetical protein